MKHSNITSEDIEAFFQPAAYRVSVANNTQVFDWAGLEGRLLSSSYMPDEKNSAYDRMMGQLRGIFERYQEGGVVRFDYLTKVYMSRYA